MSVLVQEGPDLIYLKELPLGYLILVSFCLFYRELAIMHALNVWTRVSGVGKNILKQRWQVRMTGFI